eukprot:scaffold524_cov357-Pavlova_lutheri.AAC.40
MEVVVVPRNAAEPWVLARGGPSNHRRRPRSSAKIGTIHPPPPGFPSRKDGGSGWRGGGSQFASEILPVFPWTVGPFPCRPRVSPRNVGVFQTRSPVVWGSGRSRLFQPSTPYKGSWWTDVAIDITSASTSARRTCESRGTRAFEGTGTHARVPWDGSRPSKERRRTQGRRQEGKMASCVGPMSFRASVAPARLNRSEARMPRRGASGKQVTVMGNPGAGGPFAPIVVLTRNVMGKKEFNQFRGKAIAMHSQVIKSFCKEIGADTKQVQGLIRLAKKNGEKLGFLA